MVIIRISPGFANSIMEFCGGYALARELGEEYVLDVGLCQDSAWGYLVDMFNIPDCKKNTYYTVDYSNREIQNNLSIPQELRENARLIRIPDYSCIDNAKFLVSSQTDIYLNDYFMDQQKYFMKYWDELGPMMSYKGQSENIESFKEMIKGRTSVGVHVRRGDMLYSGYALTEDNYYKAAIEYCRKKIDRDALFCVFSDDIGYARELLGNDRNIKYVHFVGYDEVDVEEFVCLSLCDHRIRSKTSTYGDFADRINGSKDKITLLQGDLEYRSPFRKLYLSVKNTAVYYYVKRVTGTIKGRSLDEMEEIFKRRRFNKKHFNYKIMDRTLIKKYSSLYIYKDYDNEVNTKINKILSAAVSADNAHCILERMIEFEMNYCILSKQEDVLYRYKKFQCYYAIGDYERAIGLADYIWGWMKEDNEFRYLYSSTLNNLGIKEESRLVSAGRGDLRFIIISDIPATYSSSLYGFGELAVGLAKMGCDVTLVENPGHESEEICMRDSDFMTNRHDVMYGIKWYTYESVKGEGFAEFIDRITSKGKRRNKTFVMARNPQVFSGRADDVKYIWFDNNDNNDPEKSYYVSYGSMMEMDNLSDYVLTCKPNQYLDYSKHEKLIVYNNYTKQIPYWTVSSRWKQHDCHRLSDRTINICESIGCRLSD